MINLSVFNYTLERQDEGQRFQKPFTEKNKNASTLD